MDSRNLNPHPHLPWHPDWIALAEKYPWIYSNPPPYPYVKPFWLVKAMIALAGWLRLRNERKARKLGRTDGR